MTEKLRILIVDDEQVILDSTRKILSSEGWQVLTAPDAESAVRILAAEAPHLVISDLVLPGASGMNLLDRASERDPGLVIIITTGYSTVENAAAALKHGAFDFLPKPFSCDELMSCAARARRAIDLRLTLGARMPQNERVGDFCLGSQTWARPEKDGSAVLGVSDFHLRTVGPIEAVILPEIGSELRQGGRLVWLRATDGLVHNVWSPLGGSVLVHNDRLLSRPQDLADDPRGAGWIARVHPADLDRELRNLIEP